MPCSIAPRDPAYLQYFPIMQTNKSRERAHYSIINKICEMHTKENLLCVLYADHLCKLKEDQY